MTITSIVGSDGSVRITLDGHELKLREASIDAARGRVLDHAKSYAASTGVVQTLTASDPTGEWMMYVYPTGDIVPAPPASVVQTAPAVPIVPPTTIARPPASQLGEAAAPVSVAPAVDEDVEHTILMHRRTRQRITVHLSTGEAITTAAPALLGRRPAPRAGHSTVPLTSPGREVSRMHAVVDVDELGRLVVVDEDSANGTYINGERLTPGVPTVLPADALLELGDITIRIEPTA